MRTIYLILDKNKNVTGWTLTKDFANRILAQGETIKEMVAKK
jgi:hypothetical protein